MSTIPKKLNLTGQKYGRLTVVKQSEYKNKKVYWLCKCDCGNFCKVPTGNLRSGNTTSCGCIHRDMMRKRLKTHGHTNTRLYVIWSGVKDRCYNVHCKIYKYYGQRGIKLCDDWKDKFQSFYDWAISNGYDDTLTIDRIDANGNYEPNNCRFVTQKEQARNRRSNRNYTINGVTKCLKEWCEVLGLNYRTVYSRLHYGWTIIEALQLKKRGK